MTGDQLHLVVGIETIYVRQKSIYGIVAYPIGLRLHLENGGRFEMYNVPIDVIEALELMNSGDPPPRRQSMFTFLTYNETFRDVISQYLDKVVIDEFDENTGLYTATVHFQSDGIHLTIKMIPSHAIFLAKLAERPVYVSDRLVQIFLDQDMDEYEEEYLDEEDEEYDEEDYGF